MATTEVFNGPDTERKELHGHMSRSGATAHNWMAWIVGIPAMFAGSAMVLAALDFIPAGIGRNAWVLQMFGWMFAGSGVWLSISGVRGMWHRSRVARMREFHPGEPWYYEYPWRREGMPDDTLKRIRGSILGCLFFTFFLVPFNYILFSENLGWFVLFPAVIIGIFDLVAVAMIVGLVGLVIRYFKFGTSYLRFKQIPFRLGDELQVQLEPSTGIRDAKRFKFELRCVQEAYEVKHHGKNAAPQIVCYQIWADSLTTDTSGSVQPGEFMPISFQLPNDPKLSTDLGSRPPRFWELDISAETPGVDYGATFVVPVYSASE